MRDARQDVVDRPKTEAVPKGKRWWSVLGLMVVLAIPLPAAAQFSIQIAIPGISIGINQPVYPQLVEVPGYPVYYDPGSASNYFFYDGLYWVFEGDNWYASSWYNGPWALVGPQYVPVFLLRIPVRYYRQPPMYFRAWRPDAPPRWGDHWGHDWEREHSGWDRWDRHSVPAPAPLPVYQREYSGRRYPQQVEQQQALRNENYRYQPRDAAVKQVHQAEVASRPVQQQAQQPDRGRPQQQAQPASRLAPQATPAPQQANDRREQPEKGKQQQAQQPERGKPQQQAQPASRPAPQATPQPQQANDRREQPEKGKQQQAQQPERGKPQQQAQPASRPAPQASQGQGEAQRNDARAPEQDKGHPGKNEAPEPKGNSPQARGQDRGQEHDR